MLDAGLPLSRVLSVLAFQASGRLRRILQKVGTGIDEGATLSEAFQAQGVFPPLFLTLVAACYLGVKPLGGGDNRARDSDRSTGGYRAVPA